MTRSLGHDGAIQGMTKHLGHDGYDVALDSFSPQYVVEGAHSRGWW
jgi:hypothetical protein